METGINSLKDILQLIIGFIGVGSLAFTAYSYHLSKKQFNFAVIINCTERFQKILPLLESEDQAELEKAIGLYIDLCNEQLFYFENKYLPKEIIEEWTDGMLDYLPYFDENGNNINKNLLSEKIETHKSFDKNPRLRKTFTASNKTKKLVLRDEQFKKKFISNVKENLEEMKKQS
jgi:hypothetical protein